MAKNAVDAHRKLLRKKEVAKNKQDRKKAREISVVKKDTRSLEGDIRKLTTEAQRGPLSAAKKEELDSLRGELARITKAKTEYVEAHPEHRKFVFPERSTTEGGSASGPQGDRDPPGLYGRDGKLKHPERSLYYDPVFNPFGAPPPGMPYREKPPTPEEMAAFRPVGAPMQEEDSGDEDDEEEDDDDDIVMPAGPPPGSDDSDSDDSDDSLGDIPMPEGPPPLKPQPPSNRITINRPQSGPPHQQQRGPHHRPPFAQPFHPDPQMRHPPRNFRPPPPPAQLPPRPSPGAAGQQQDPLSNQPTQTFQAYQEARRAPPPPPPPAEGAPLPPPPPPGMPAHFVAAGGGAGGGATISAAPVLRDLKKEATAFLPSHLRRKVLPASSAAKAGLASIDPTQGQGAGVGREKVSLMGALEERGIAGAGKEAGAGEGQQQKKKVDRGKEDYERFQREMEGFL